jgi:hypothetical protein
MEKKVVQLAEQKIKTAKELAANKADKTETKYAE